MMLRDVSLVAATPPESGEVAATKEISRSIASGADGVVPLPKRLKNVFREMVAYEPPRLCAVNEASQNLLSAQPPLVS